MSFSLTPGNIDDRTVVENLVDKLQGWPFGDHGYISKNLLNPLPLANEGLELILMRRVFNSFHSFLLF